MNSWSNGEVREPQGAAEPACPHSTSGYPGVIHSALEGKEGNSTQRGGQVLMFFSVFLSLSSLNNIPETGWRGILCSYLARRRCSTQSPDMDMPAPQRGTHIVQITDYLCKVLDGVRCLPWMPAVCCVLGAV